MPLPARLATAFVASRIGWAYRAWPTPSGSQAASRSRAGSCRAPAVPHVDQAPPPASYRKCRAMTRATLRPIRAASSGVRVRRRPRACGRIPRPAMGCSTPPSARRGAAGWRTRPGSARRTATTATLAPDRRAHLRRTQRVHPAQSGTVHEVFEAHPRGQAPIPDRHHPFGFEVPAQFGHPVGNDVEAGVGRVARMGPDHHRASARSGRDRVHHLRPTAPAVAIAAEAHRRAGAPVMIASAHVGEHRPAFPRTAPGEPAPDARPARKQPVRCPVRRVLVGIAQVGLSGQCRGMPQPGRRGLQCRCRHAFHDHRHDPVALEGTSGGAGRAPSAGPWPGAA